MMLQVYKVKLLESGENQFDLACSISEIIIFLLTHSKKFLEPRTIVRFWSEVNGRWDYYNREIGIAICFSFNRLIYIRKATRYCGNYHHNGIEKFWVNHCTGNLYCDITNEDYMEYISLLPNDRFGKNSEIHRYRLWMNNAIRRIKRAGEVGKKIRSANIIREHALRYIYRSDSF